jgi:predicted SprT family Zn-dependent metalloprotease
MNNPTTQTYTSLATAYDFFNRELFSGSLPPCLITMQRHKNAYGYFSGERFANTSDPKEITDEIALNPALFANRKPHEVLSTLVHEMVHLWQHHYGKPPRKGYHDRQWAAKMREIGLIPTATGEEGGKETGQKMTHRIAENGNFALAVKKLLAEHPAILYHDRADEHDTIRKKKAASKTKYTCPGCGLNAWAKPDAPLVCGNCQEPMQAENVEEEDE